MPKHFTTTLIVCAISAICSFGYRHAAAGELPHFTTTRDWSEQQRELRIDGARVLINAAAADRFDPAQPTRLIVYALPNGNTIEQTFGCRLAPGMDWHFDIQHIAAQLRRLREIDRGRNYVVALVEADGKSWPTWCHERADAGERVRRTTRAIVEALGSMTSPPPRVALVAHSGGGAFVTSFVNAGDEMPANVDRIAFLDAYYKYSNSDDATTAARLSHWLRADASRRLIVVAYDDRNVTLNGKKVITSDDGGSFRAAGRLLDALTHDFATTQMADDGPVRHITALAGQAHFILHANPQNLILHTRLVEWNGLLRAMTIGSDLPQDWVKLTETRDYDPWIQPAPLTLALAPSTQLAPATEPATAPHIPIIGPSTRASPDKPTIPPRPADAPGGRAFFAKLDVLSPRDRDEAVFAEVTRGNVPPFLRRFVTIQTSFTGPDGAAHRAELRVSPDYLAVGGDDDFVRVPMTPMTAQRIADAFACALPTRKMVDDVYAHADVKLDPRPLTIEREAARTFVQHNDIIEAQRREANAALCALVAGIKKDIVVTNRLAEQPNRVAIYGWHKLDGKPIQPLTIVHKSTYADYSHGVRLVAKQVTIDGRPMNLTDVLKDPRLSAAFSDEGAMTVLRYPTDWPETMK